MKEINCLLSNGRSFFTPIYLYRSDCIFPSLAYLSGLRTAAGGFYRPYGMQVTFQPIASKQTKAVLE